MISCVHEDKSMTNENIMTLKYSAHAMAIKGRFGKQKEKNKEELAQYKQMIAMLQKEISSLKGKLQLSQDSSPTPTLSLADNSLIEVLTPIEKKLRRTATSSNQQYSAASLNAKENRTPKGSFQSSK